MQPQPIQPDPIDPRLGMMLQDRYRILRKVGDGGMGSVYEGEHVLIHKRVAVKVLHQQFAGKPEIVARFHREAEAATSIGHPNIVEVNDIGRLPDGTAYMVLEFLQGRDWAKDISTEGPQPLGKVVHILSQVCDALGAAHAKGIVHRDMKPENIFLIERGNDPAFAKVVDFGISKIAAANAEDRSLTQTGTALGTPYYMAPEQCQGKKDVDPRADIYALGVILFQSLTRHYPFDDESYPMLVLKICTEPAPPLAYYRTDLPPELQQIVERMLAKDKNQRFSSCAEVKAALEPYRWVNVMPALAANAPSLASRGPTVLERGAVGPAPTPSGTAVLPDMTPPQPEPPIAPAPSGGGGLRIVAMLAVLMVLGIGGASLGAWAAGVFTPEPVHRDPQVARAGNGPTPPVPNVPPNVPVTASTEPLVAHPTPPPTPVPAPTPAQDTIHVTISATPANAHVFLDGAPISNPFAFEPHVDPLPAPGQQPTFHHLRVEAEGYQTQEQDLTFRFDHTTVPIALEPVGRATHVHERVVPTSPPMNTQSTPQPFGGGAAHETPPPPPHQDLLGGGTIFH